MKRVLCNASVDASPTGQLVVTVHGIGEHTGEKREYTFPAAEKEDSAAMEGIRRFVEELGGAA
jgi:alpha-beta hydrolase superfamily lysophospholipase